MCFFFSDLAIGSYLSSNAVVLRSKPIVALSLSIPGSKNITLKRNDTEFVMDICSTYTGKNVPDFLRRFNTYFDQFI